MPDQTEPAQTPARDERARVLLRIVAELARESQGKARKTVHARLDSSLERDLGIDSLARVELLLRIERAFQLRLPEHLLATAETPGDLLRALAQGSAAIPGPGVAAAAPVEEPLAGVETPEAASTLIESLDWHAAAHAKRIHIVLLEDGERAEPMTYGDLRSEAGGIAAGLAGLGIGAGEAVAIMLPTSRDFFRVFFGVLLAGAVPVPIYPPARPSQIEDHLRRQSGILANCEARALVTIPEAQPVAGLLRDRVPSLERILVPSQLVTPDFAAALPSRGTQDLALLQYTSGSTGNPKGVTLTHANVLANLRAMGQAVGAGSSDVFVSWLPLYHDMGLIGAWLGGLYYAFPLVVMPPTAFLTRPSRWLHAIHRYRGTLSSAPNFAYEVCATRVDERDLAGLDLGSWRLAFNGAEPVSPGTLSRFAGRFAKYGLRPEALAPVYGLAECAVGLAFPPTERGPRVDRVDRQEFARSGRALPARSEDPNPLRFPGCGQPLPGHQMRIVDEGGRELPERTEGRIEFRGPSATAGYFRNPEATRRLFDGDWLDTGDLGYFAEGEIHLTGRVKDVVIRGGQHVHPFELEEAVGNLAGVRKGCVAVFGVSDPVAGTERIVVLAETRVADLQARSKLRTEIAELALTLLGTPADDIVLAPAHTVLKTSSGKIRRAASRELYERGLIGVGRVAAWKQWLGFARTAARARLRRAARGAVEALYAGYLWTLFFALVLAALPVMALPRLAWRRGFARFAARGVLRASGLPISLRGFETFPRERPVMVVANHASYLDSILLFGLLPRQCSFVAKRELRGAAALGLLLRSLGVRFVERFDIERGAEDARELGRLAGGGESMVFFPEGTFTRAPGLRTFHIGAFMVSAGAAMPVVPVAIRGTRSVLRDGQWLPRRGPVQILAGPLLEAEGRDWSTAVALRDRARAEILARCGEPDLAPS